jgi:hypothetical protein
MRQPHVSFSKVYFYRGGAASHDNGRGRENETHLTQLALRWQEDQRPKRHEKPASYVVDRRKTGENGAKATAATVYRWFTRAGATVYL